MSEVADSIYQVHLIYRHIHGISLNPREYVMENEDVEKEMEFPDKASALAFAEENGIDLSDGSGEYVSAFAEIECRKCNARYWEEEATAVEVCPRCGNEDKTQTVVLVPKHLQEGDNKHMERT